MLEKWTNVGGILILLVVVSCSSGKSIQVRYDDQSNQTVYETNPESVSTLSGEGIGTSKSIEMKVIARCRGTNCTPGTALFVFSASGNQKLSLSGTGGKIIADDIQISWTSDLRGTSNVTRTGNRLQGVRTVAGRFAAVEISFGKLSQIASASTVEGSIGGVPINFDSGVQSSLQKLVQKARKVNSEK